MKYLVEVSVQRTVYSIEKWHIKAVSEREAASLVLQGYGSDTTIFVEENETDWDLSDRSILNISVLND